MAGGVVGPISDADGERIGGFHERLDSTGVSLCGDGEGDVLDDFREGLLLGTGELKRSVCV